MKNKYFFLLFLIPFFLVVFWFRHGNIMAGGESGLPFYNLQRQLDINSYSWADPALGNSLGIGVAAKPFFQIGSWIQKVGAPGFIIEALFFWILLVVSGVSVWFFTKELFPHLQEKYLFLSALFYWFNPISLVNVWNRFLYNFMIFWAFLPLGTYLFLRGIKNKDFKFSIIISLTSVVFVYAFTSIVFVILLWALYFYIFIFYFLFDKKGRLFYILYFLFTLFSFSLFNFWWLAQLLSFVFSSGYNRSVAEYFTSTGNLLTLISLSNRLGQFVDTLRFMHSDFFLTGPIWARIYAFFPFGLIEFLPAGLCFWCIYKFRKKWEILMLGCIFVFSFFLIKGNAQPFGEFFEKAFVKISFLQVFRNPFEKFSFFIPLVSAPLLMFAVDKLGMFKTLIRVKKFILPFTFFFIFVFLGFPFWTGLVFTSNESVVGQGLRKYEVKVPDYYQVVNEWLSKNSTDSRFLVLPIGGEAVDYTWDNPYSGVELSPTFFDIPNISFNTTIPFYGDLVTTLSKYQMDQSILNFFPFTNARYILLRSDVDFKNRHMADPSVVKLSLDTLQEKGLVQKRFESGKLTVYELDRKWLWPKVYVANNPTITNSVDLNKASRFLIDFPKEKSVLLSYVDIKNMKVNGRLVIEPKDAFLQKVVTPMPNDLKDEDLLAKLFYVRYLPGDLLYPFIRFKERIEETAQTDYLGELIYKNGLLGKRAVEVYKLRKVNSNPVLIKNAEQEYRDSLSDLTPTILGQVGENTAISSLIKDSLLYQSILLNRVNSEEAADLSKLLANWGIKPKFDLPVLDEEYAIFSFSIPVSGRYTIKLPSGLPSSRIYLDGKLLFERYSPDVTVDLTVGSHELSFVLDDKYVFNPQIKEESFSISKDNSPSWTVAIPSIPVKYKVQFDYRFVRGSGFDFQFTQDIDNPETSVWAANVRKSENFHGWNSWDSEFVTTPGASKAVLHFSPVLEKICKITCNFQKQNFEVEIKNLKVSKINMPEDVYLVLGKDEQKASDTKVNFEKVSPTEYKVVVNKASTNPEILVFSELFNSGWQAKYGDGQAILSEKHFPANLYANGWVIDKTGSYEITLKFAPQRLLETGEIISVISTLSGTLLVLILIKRRVN